MVGEKRFGGTQTSSMLLGMSASAIRRKSYKKAQEEAGPFSPVHWEEGGSGGGSEVPPGKLQVMEKFFTPVRQATEGKGASDLALRDCRCHLQWTESRSDRFSTLSSSASPSASSSLASWSSEASLDKEAFLRTGSRHRPEHSQSCVDVSREAGDFGRGRERAKAEVAYKVGEPAGSFAWLRKGQSSSADQLPCHLPGHCELPSLPGQVDSADQHLYKVTSLERSLALNEETEVLAPRQPHQARVLAPTKGILKNGAAAGGDRLRKAKSIETIMVRSTGRESWPAPGLGPTRPLRRERQPPNSLDLSTPKKPPMTERMKLVEEKLRFSEFLDEITWQVMSPSSLSSLGWKPPEAAVAGKGPSTDASDSKGSSSKASSAGSLLDMADGKVKEERAFHGVKKGPGQLEAKQDAIPASCHHRNQARTMDEASISPELDESPMAHLPANLGSLPRLWGEASKAQRKQGEAKVKHGMATEGQVLPPKEVEREATGMVEKPNSKEQQEAVAAKIGPHVKELLVEMNVEQPMPPQDQDPTTPLAPKGVEVKSGSAQQDLQKTWEELGNLKEKFSKLQEQFSHSRVTNQLLEEKLQIIAQSMAEERQTSNQRINELLERLISSQNMICTLENMNISGLLSKSGLNHRRSEKAESLDSLCSLHLLDVTPPPAFMDGASDAQNTPSHNLATEPSMLGCSFESDPVGANGEQAPQLKHGAPKPLPEGSKKHSKNRSRAVAFTPWKQKKSTKFSTEPVNSTESECSGEETAPICPLPTSRFLYLRQETVVAPSGPDSFPPLPIPEPVVFEMVRPPSPSSLSLSGQLELVPELSSSESSDEGEVSWSPGLVEKTSGSHLDYQSAQKMLDSLLHKNSEQEKSREKASRKTGRLGGRHLGSKPGRSLGHEHRIRCYEDFLSLGEELPKGNSYPCSQHAVGLLLRATKQAAVGLEGREAAQDSTSL